MFPKPKLLCTGHDPLLLETRKWMLEKEFEVETADTIEATLKSLDSRAFDLLLLCHSLTDHECEVICAAVFSRTPTARVLQLTGSWSDIRAFIGPEEQTSAARPQNLIRKVTGMIRKAQAAGINSPDFSGTR